MQNLVKNSWAFVTFYLIHFGQHKCGTHWGYPKYCYSRSRWKDYTVKLKRNRVMRLPNCLDIKETVVLHFLCYPKGDYHAFPYFKINKERITCVFTIEFRQLDLEWWNYQLCKAFWGYCDIVATNEVTY